MLSQNNNSSVIYSVEDIQRLVTQAKRGDKESFALLYQHFLTPLYRYVLSHCKDVSLTDDVCQTTFLRFYTSLDRYQLKETPLVYLFTIARRILINEHQKMKPDLYDDEMFESFHDEHDFVSDIDIQITYKNIEVFIDELSEGEQEVLSLFYKGELSIQEIASLLEKTEDWVRQVKHRALKKLQAKVKNIYE